MDHLLEHPLEAVAFRLYSLPIPDASAATTGAAAAWTCLAAVLAAAAAAGIWRLRSSPSSTPAPLAVPTKPEVSPPEPSTRPPSSQRSTTEPATAAATTAAMATVPSPKETYTAYYRDAGCVVGCCDEDGDEEVDEDEDEDAEEHEDGDRDDVFVLADPFRWEVVRSLPLSPTASAETGRYRYRRSPAAALIGSGSVVQLWDQRRVGGAGGLTPTAAASPRRRGRGGLVLATVSAF